MSPGTALRDVFGIGREVQNATYVDRGGLDRRLETLLQRDQHVVIHGDTKQGKSWLRRRHLDDTSAITLQCVNSYTPERLLEEALAQVGVRAELKRTATNTLDAQMRLGAAAEAGLPLIGRGKVRAEAQTGAARERVIEEVTFGQQADNLGWVSRVLSADGRRIVVEDFHYFPQAHRAVMAHWMKAFWDMGLFLIVVGAWTDANFLITYNGDLDGRMSDVEVRWTEAELDRVLLRGCDSLKIEMSSELRAQLVAASYGNVGLLQRLALELCELKGIAERERRKRQLNLDEDFDGAARLVADAMRPRFAGFAQRLCEGRAANHSPAYGRILQSFLTFGDRELITGVSRRDLRARVEEDFPGCVSENAFRNAIDRLETVQQQLEVKPLVITLGDERRTVRLADRGLLFSKRYGSWTWPWEQPGTESLF